MSRTAGEAWRFRTMVEREAHVRFARLAAGMRTHGFGEDLAARADKASDDEKRHAALCLELANALGTTVEEGGWEAAPYAPTVFDARDALVYELAALSCVAESESMATLSVLMDSMKPSRFRDAVIAIARDEVEHARIGWAALGRESQKRSLAFLEPYLAPMIDRGGGPLFAVAPALEEPGIVELGVLPHEDKRRVFVEALEEVIVPGFKQLGIATHAIDRWLAARS